MKRIFLILLSIFMQGNLIATTAQLEAQKEAVDIVAAISENLAALIIHHKKESNPELTKHHSVELVKSITEIITLCIMNARAKKTSVAQPSSLTRRSSNKDISIYDQKTLDGAIEQIAISLVQTIEKAEGNA